MTDNRLFAVASFGKVYDVDPKQQTPVTWEELKRRLLRHRALLARKDGELWSPTEYKPGAKREAVNVLTVHCFVLDMDEAGPWEPYAEIWAAEGFSFVIHTTFHHTKEKPRWRVIFPLLHPQPGYAWHAIWERVAWGLARQQQDPKCSDPCRLYWLPSHPKGDEAAFAFFHDGSGLDVARFTETPPRPERAPLPEGTRRTLPEKLVEDALCEARKHGRNAGLMWLLVQLRDNDYGRGESEALACALYLPHLWDTNTKGKHEPFSDRNVEQVARSVFARGAREPWAQGKATAAPAPVSGHDTGAPPPAVAEGGEARNWRTFTFREMAEMRPEEPQFPVEGLLREGINLCMGKTGDGKTWLSVDAAMAVASGGKALGHRDVIQGDVLYLAFEEARSEMFQRILQIREERQDFPRLQVASASDEDWPMESTSDTLAALEEWLVLHPEARLVVFDPLLGYLAAATPNSAIVQADYNMIRSLRTIARRHPGVAFLVHDHRSKAAIGNGRDPQDTGVHSTGVIAAADNRLALVREEGNVFKLYVKGRMVPSAELKLQFDQGTGSWEVKDDRRTLRQSEVGAAIDRELSLAYPESLHYRELALRIGVSIGTVKGRLFRMEQGGKVAGEGGGRYRLIVGEQNSS